MNYWVTKPNIKNIWIGKKELKAQKSFSLGGMLLMFHVIVNNSL